MNNTLYTNRFNAQLVTCAAHFDAYRQNFFGDLVNQGPTDKPCRLCVEAQQHAEHPAKVREALASPKLSHTRARRWGSYWFITIYHRDETSPTGVRAAESCNEALFNELQRDLKLSSSYSPLSPTEGR